MAWEKQRILSNSSEGWTYQNPVLGEMVYLTRWNNPDENKGWWVVWYFANPVRKWFFKPTVPVETLKRDVLRVALMRARQELDTVAAVEDL